MQTKYTKNAMDPDDDEDFDVRSPFSLIEKKKPYKEYSQIFPVVYTHYYLCDEIGDPDGYVDMTHRILTAEPNDIIYIHLNTIGGRLDTGVQIINAMQNSRAHIVTVLESMAYSLGTLIFLAGDEMVVNDHCVMMFHNFRGGIVGKGNEIILQLDATVKWFSELAKSIYIPFLSKEEFERLIAGQDLWMQSDEIRKRLDKMLKAVQEPKPTRSRKRKQDIED